MEKIFEIEDGMLLECLDKDIVEATIPEGVDHIGAAAFSKCEKLKSIHIPDSVTMIRSWAFEGCKNLQSINIPRLCCFY